MPENASVRATTGSSSPARPGPHRFRRLVGPACLVAALLPACTIAPVVSAPDPPTGRYLDCDRAALAYCDEVVGAEGALLERCVAERRFECVSGGTH